MAPLGGGRDGNLVSGPRNISILSAIRHRRVRLPFLETRRVKLRRAWGLLVLPALFCLIGLSVAASAAEPWSELAETVFENIGREQGLPNPIPISLAQDGDGFLWIGTQGGLTRWDGYRFRDYQPHPKDQTALPDGWIETLHTDVRGRLWIGMMTGGLARYDREQDRFVRVSLGRSGVARTHVGAIADDGASGLWIGTDRGVEHLDTDTGAVTILQHNDGQPGSIPAGQIQIILPDSTGRLWVGTRTGLAYRDAGRENFTPVPLANSSGATVGVGILFEDRDRRIWIGTNGHGIYLLDASATIPRRIEESNPATSPLATDWVCSITAVNEHEIWFGTRESGILVLDPTTGQTRRIRHDRTLPDSLAHDAIWAVLKDKAGSMWVGSTGGLSYLANGAGAVSTVFGGTNQISDPDIYSIMTAKDGRVWLGLLGGGIDIIDPVAGRVAQLRADPTHTESALPKDVVLAMTEAANGDVYVGTFRGLYRVSGTGRDVSLVALSPARDIHAPARSLLIHNDMLWVGDGTDGLWGAKFAGSDLSVVFGPEQAAGLNDRNIDSIVPGVDHDLWVGTRNGLNRIDLETYKIEQIQPNPDDDKSLPARFVSSLLLDRHERLWVSTFGGGIAVMTGRGPDGKPQFRQLSVADGLPHINVDKLLLDTRGRVWAGTDDGLAMIDPATFRIRALHRAEGAVLSNYFANAGAIDAAGEPMFGAKDGVSVIRSERLQDWTLRPPLVVTDIRVGGTPVPSSRLNGAEPVEPLVLRPETNSLTVEFSALDFTAPERNRYAYRLDGFDRDWIETDPTRRLAAYTNLPPGAYTLQLRGSNRDGVWTDRDLQIPVVVLPAWYQTLWFMIAMAIMGLALVAAIVRSRTAYLHRRQAELERQIAEHTSDLRSANEQLYELATVDPLSGCANRRHFVERAQELIALSHRAQSPLCLIIMDIDLFKRVNDIYGHPAGDEVLRMVGRLGRAHIRATDLLGRIGGEEFAMLIPHTGTYNATLFAERLREAIGKEESYIDGTILRITVSLGLAELRRDEGFDKLYARADAALYAAKEGGRNRVIVDEMV